MNVGPTLDLRSDSDLVRRIEEANQLDMVLYRRACDLVDAGRHVRRAASQAARGRP